MCCTISLKFVTDVVQDPVVVNDKLPHRNVNSVAKLLKDILGNKELAQSLLFVNDQRILIDVIMRELTQSEVRAAWMQHYRPQKKWFVGQDGVSGHPGADAAQWGCRPRLPTRRAAGEVQVAA